MNALPPSSIRRAFGIFNWLRKKQRLVQGISQQLGSQHVAFQQSSYMSNAVCMNAIGTWQQSAGCQSNLNYAGQAAAAGNQLKIDNGNIGRANDRQFGLAQGQNAGIAGLISQDGTPRFFKWDAAKGCMVPFKPSTPLIHRLARSIDAFLRSWRLG